MSNNPLAGINYFISGLKLLFSPGLRLFVWIPLLVNIIIFSLFIYWATNELATFNDYLMSFIPEWLSFLYWLIWLLAGLTIFFLVAVTFNIVANLLGAPFNGILAEKTEAKMDQFSGVDLTLSNILSITARTIFREISKLLYYLPRAILLLIITLIPGVQIIAPVLWFLFAAWMMAIQYGDYPMDNNGVSFKELKQTLRSKKMIAFGFGTAVLVGLMIPIINFLVMPSAVIGATLMWIKEFKYKEDNQT